MTQLATFQTSHEYMEEWLRNQLPSYLHRLYEKEGRKHASCVSCGTDAALIRCLECFSSPEFCQMCCRREHRRNPLHRIEAWNGEHWQPAWLWQTGSILCLGHAGDPCPQYQSSREDLEGEVMVLTGMDDMSPSNLQNDDTFGFKPQAGTLGRTIVMAIMHTNGFHYVPVYPCLCDPHRTDKDLHLLDIGLYPATSSETQTAFTMALLKQFHLLKIAAHISAENYCEIIRRLTNPVFPKKILVRDRCRVFFPRFFN